MAATLLEVPEFLEELKNKRLKVAELEAEITRLHVLLIEKDSELNSKSSHFNSLEAKYQRIQLESNQLIAELQRRLKVSQEENQRLVLEAAGVEEKCRRQITEKKIMELKITTLETAVQDKEKQVQSLTQTLKEMHCRQEKLAQTIEDYVKKQEEITDLCQTAAASVAERQHETDQHVKRIQKVKKKLQETEKQLCDANARIQVLESGLTGQSLLSKREQIETMTLQLKTAQKRESQLRNELSQEREERLKMERKIDEVFQNFVAQLHRTEEASHTGPSLDHSTLAMVNQQELTD